MKLEGTYEIPAPRKKVWDAFFDPKPVSYTHLTLPTILRV